MTSADQRDCIHSKDVDEMEERRKVTPHVATIQLHLCKEVRSLKIAEIFRIMCLATMHRNRTMQHIPVAANAQYNVGKYTSAQKSQ